MTSDDGSVVGVTSSMSASSSGLESEGEAPALAASRALALLNSELVPSGVTDVEGGVFHALQM